MPGKLAPVGLSPEEVTLLTSILAIVAIRADMHWEISTSHEATVHIVNIDNHEGAMFLGAYTGEKAMISYSAKSDPADIFSLQKPLRARDLLKALEVMDTAPVLHSVYQEPAQQSSQSRL